MDDPTQPLHAGSDARRSLWRRTQGERFGDPRELLQHLAPPVVLLVAVLVAAAWYVTWATSGLSMSLLALGSPGPVELLLAFALFAVMMVAMMLPSALPMVLTYHGMTRLEAGRPTRPADGTATALFASSYFVVWGLFTVAAWLGLTAIGVLGSPEGPFVLVPSLTLFATGAYQITRTKEACLRHCQSPLGFVMNHWKNGRLGAWRMGLQHALYCVGCCWLFMVALFVAGAMSLLWMGAISLVILVEKIGWRPRLVTRAVGVVFVAAGAVLAVPALLSL